MSTTRICKGCSQPIHGPHLHALNRDWHPEHFCCIVCQEPITDGRFYAHQEQPCHPHCYEETLAPRCTICNKALLDNYQRNEWGDTYCPEHAKELATCSYCGRLVPHVTRRTRRREVENIRCDHCAATAIETLDQAKVHIPNLIDWVETQGAHFRQKSFRLDVLDRADFLAREGGRRDPLGLTTSTRTMRNQRVDQAKIEEVAIMRGLPRILFEGVCVHELGHVWLVQHKIVNLPIMDEEGFCELLSYHYYLSTPAVGAAEEEVGQCAQAQDDRTLAHDRKVAHFYARNIARNSSPIYGDGFRKVQRLEERVGFAQILKSLQRKKKLPL